MRQCVTAPTRIDLAVGTLDSVTVSDVELSRIMDIVV